MKCPLCLSNNNRLLETIQVRELARLYKRAFGNEVGYLFGDIKEIEYIECTSCFLRFFSPCVTGDERFYNSLQKFEWYYMEDKFEYDIAKKHIAENSKILEVGAGSGAFRKYVPNCEYTGLEFSIEAIKKAYQQGITILDELVENHAEKNPEAYDAVVSFQVMEHVENPNSFVKAELKALKHGGLLITALPSESSFLSDTVNGVLNMPPHHVTRYTDECLSNLSSLFNLELLSIEHEKLQPVHYEYYTAVASQKRFLNPKLVDISFKRRLIGKILSKVSFLRCKLDTSNLPRGQAVVATWRKM